MSNKTDPKIPLVAAAIFKNEAPYIIDWLAWHRAVGFNYFFIANNDSTDETETLLGILQNHGILTYINFSSDFYRKPQISAYHYFCNRIRRVAKWIAFIDADEFIYATGAEKNILNQLNKLPDNVGAIGLNWATFGSGGHLKATHEPVFIRFQKRGLQTEAVNHHYKSIVRSEAVIKPARNSHRFILKPNFHYSRIDGSLFDLDTNQPCSTKTISWNNWRINHYIIKSWTEFYNKKLPKGIATRRTEMRHIDFFRLQDKNDEDDAPSSEILERYAFHKNNLLRILGEHRSLADNAEHQLNQLESPINIPELSDGILTISTTNTRMKPIWSIGIKYIHRWAGVALQKLAHPRIPNPPSW